MNRDATRSGHREAMMKNGTVVEPLSRCHTERGGGGDGVGGGGSRHDCLPFCLACFSLTGLRYSEG